MEVARILLENNADPHIRDKTGETAQEIMLRNIGWDPEEVEATEPSHKRWSLRGFFFRLRRRQMN